MNRSKQQIMGRQSGFTLIELVIVIIILGILAVTAAPKFIDLQGDARYSTLKGLKGALESASALTFSKAAIGGKERSATETITVGANTVNIVYGYPKATQADLTNVTDISGKDWEFSVSGTRVTIWPVGVSSASANCSVTYEEATSSSTATITVDATDADAC